MKKFLVTLGIVFSLVFMAAPQAQAAAMNVDFTYTGRTAALTHYFGIFEVGVASPAFGYGDSFDPANLPSGMSLLMGSSSHNVGDSVRVTLNTTKNYGVWFYSAENNLFSATSPTYNFQDQYIQAALTSTTPLVGLFGFEDLWTDNSRNVGHSYDGDFDDMMVSASSAVPLPAAVWLLGSGLLGLIGLKKRRNG